MSILADWYRKMMGTDRATLIAKDNAAHGEMKGWGSHLAATKDWHCQPISPAMQAKIDYTRQRIAESPVQPVADPHPESLFARMVKAVDSERATKEPAALAALTKEQRSARTAKGNRTRRLKREMTAKLRAEVEGRK